VITIQRVRVRWSAASRGAPQANARRGLCRPMMLPPSLPAGDVVVHDVLADETNGYACRGEVAVGGAPGARDLGPWLSTEPSRLVVDRLPGWAAYPRQSGPGRLFTLLPGQVGRYRANFRLTVTTCACDPSWYYEEWLILVANDRLRGDELISRQADHDVDHRVHLYGGRRRTSRRKPGLLA
jgi:hypothetical protein